MLWISNKNVSHTLYKPTFIMLLGLSQVAFSPMAYSQEKGPSERIEELDFDLSTANAKYRHFSILELPKANQGKDVDSDRPSSVDPNTDVNIEKNSFDIIEEKENQFSENDKQIHHPDFEEYLKKEKIRKWTAVSRFERIYQFANLLDLAQTVRFIKDPRWKEANPLLGSRPSSSKVIAFKLGTGAAHFAVTRMLFKSDPELAKTWAITSLTIQGGAVLWNVQTFFK